MLRRESPESTTSEVEVRVPDDSAICGVSFEKQGYAILIAIAVFIFAAYYFVQGVLNVDWKCMGFGLIGMVLMVFLMAMACQSANPRAVGAAEMFMRRADSRMRWFREYINFTRDSQQQAPCRDLPDQPRVNPNVAVQVQPGVQHRAPIAGLDSCSESAPCTPVRNRDSILTRGRARQTRGSLQNLPGVDC